MPRFPRTQRCRECRKRRSLPHFSLDARGRLGFKPTCRQCMAARRALTTGRDRQAAVR